MGLVHRVLVAVRQLLLGLSAVNGVALWLLLRRGRSAALEYVRCTYRLYTGYGLPWPWDVSPWRADMQVPRVSAEELFPEIDFTRSPELLFPFPRALSIVPHELIILMHIVRHWHPKRIVEFGTAEGRTTLNLALHSPPDCEVMTVNLPPDPPRSYVGYFYWNHPLRSKIKEVHADVTSFDFTPYQDSADFIFCDACDFYDGLTRETAAAFQMVRQDGIVLWHDYGTGADRTRYLNELARKLPLRNIRGTALVCLRIHGPEILEQVRKQAAEMRLPLGAVKTPESVHGKV